MKKENFIELQCVCYGILQLHTESIFLFSQIEFNALQICAYTEVK